MKLSVQWTRQISILFVSALEMGKCKPGTKSDVIIKYAKMIAKEWQGSAGKTPFYLVYPDYHEWIDNILQLSDFRKFKFSSPAPAKKSTRHRSEI